MAGETRSNKPYRFSLLVEGDVDVPRNLTVAVTLHVAAPTVSAQCTFVPPSPLSPPAAPPEPPSLPTVLPSGTCMCSNDCVRAADGRCDDDGPGGLAVALLDDEGSLSSAGACVLGTDCADW